MKVKISNKVKIILFIVSIIVVILIIVEVNKYLRMKKLRNNTNTIIHNDPVFGDYGETPENLLNVPLTDTQLIMVFVIIARDYGPEIAVLTEKVMRLETAHFTSPIYLKTGSGNITAFNNEYPYGWTYELKPFWEENEEMKPVGIFENVNNNWKYLQFYGKTGIINVAEILKKKSTPGAYFSTDPDLQIEYEQRLENIDVVFTASLQ